MFNKKEQRYLKSVIKDAERSLVSAIEHCQKREVPDVKHIQKLENKLYLNKGIAEKLEV